MCILHRTDRNASVNHYLHSPYEPSHIPPPRHKPGASFAQLITFSVLLTNAAWSQPPSMPPVPGNDVSRKEYGLWQNTGWVATPDGEPVSDVQFVTEGAYPRTYIRRGGNFSLVLSDADTSASTLDTLRRLDVSFTGELVNQPDALGSSQRVEHMNFYLPPCGTEGKTFVHGYKRIVYHDLYPHVDLWIFSGALGQKMLFVVHPGGNPDDITFRFNGQDDLDVDVMGWLRLQMQNKWIVLPEAVAYQYDQSNTILPVSWTVDYQHVDGSDQVGLSFGTYDPAKPLVFLIGPPPSGMGGGYDEPGLCWSTYYGGGDDDYMVQSTEDAAGNLYLSGVTNSTIATFPPAPGVTEYGSNIVSYILRFSPTENLQWKTFFGGTGDQTKTAGCAITQTSFEEGVYLAGSTNTGDLPVLQANEYWYPGVAPSFIAKFGLISGLRTWATYFPVTRITAIAATPNNRIFISGSTNSQPAFTSFADLDDPPLSADCEFWPQLTQVGFQNTSTGFIGMFNIQDRLNWFTYITMPVSLCPVDGGSFVNELAVGTSSVFMVQTSGFNGVPAAPCPPGAYCEPLTGSVDALIYEFDFDGVPLWRTFFGESGKVQRPLPVLAERHLIAVDPVTQDIVIAGIVEDYQEFFFCDFDPFDYLPGTVPMENGPGWFSTAQPFTRSAFVARFSGIDRHLVWSSYIPGTETDIPDIRAVKFDDAGSLYLAGATTGLGIPLNTYGGVYHAEAMESNEGVDQDAFLICIGPDYALRYATYFGGGAAAAYGEYICDVFQRSTNGEIYCIGSTSKGVDYTTYFPLDEGNGIPDFWPDWAGGDFEGFITSFCSETVTSVPGSTTAAPPVTQAIVIHTSQLFLDGLPDGRHAFVVRDALGHMVHQGTAMASSAARTAIDVGDLPPGAYVLECDALTTRFFRE